MLEPTKQELHGMIAHNIKHLYDNDLTEFEAKEAASNFIEFCKELVEKHEVDSG